MLTATSSASYQDVWKIYIMHFLYSFVSRTWDTAIIFYIAELTNNSLTVVGLAGFISSFTIFLFMTYIGKWLDATDRLKALKRTLVIKLTVISLAYINCAILLHINNKTSNIFQVFLYILPFMYAIARVTFCTTQQSIEKDWIVVLSEGDTIWLSKTNSIMSQIDLGCNAVAPAVTGILFTYLSNTELSILLLGMNILSIGSLYILLQRLYYSWPSLSVKKIYAQLPISQGDTEPSDVLDSQQNHKDTLNPMMQDTISETKDDLYRQNDFTNSTTAATINSSSYKSKSVAYTTLDKLKARLNSNNNNTNSYINNTYDVLPDESTDDIDDRHHTSFDRMRSSSTGASYSHPFSYDTLNDQSHIYGDDDDDDDDDDDSGSKNHNHMNTSHTSYRRDTIRKEGEKKITRDEEEDQEYITIELNDHNHHHHSSSLNKTHTVHFQSTSHTYRDKQQLSESHSRHTTNHTEDRDNDTGVEIDADDDVIHTPPHSPTYNNHDKENRVERMHHINQSSSTSSLYKNHALFMSSGCAGVMISFAMLYLTVLSFGSLMLVYLRWSGLTDYCIGLSRGGASILGFCGALLFPIVRLWWGLYDSAYIAIWYQCSLILLAAISFLILNRYYAMIMVVGATLLSRTGLWLYDLCVRQIAQETIPEEYRGVVNGQWRSLIALFDMTTYIIAMIISDPSYFWVLTTISALAVMCAALTFTYTNQAYILGCTYMCQQHLCLSKLQVYDNYIRRINTNISQIMTRKRQVRSEMGEAFHQWTIDDNDDEIYRHSTQSHTNTNTSTTTTLPNDNHSIPVSRNSHLYPPHHILPTHSIIDTEIEREVKESHDVHVRVRKPSASMLEYSSSHGDPNFQDNEYDSSVANTSTHSQYDKYSNKKISQDDGSSNSSNYMDGKKYMTLSSKNDVKNALMSD